MKEFLAKCFCIPALIQLGIALAVFLGAYAAYKLLFWGLLRAFRKEGLARKVIVATQRPMRFLSFEIAALVSVAFLKFESILLLHILNILVVATVGWLSAKIAQSFFRHSMAKYEGLEVTDIGKRSLLTQITFVYKTVMFLIIVLTLAVILMTFPNIKSIGVGILGSAGIAGIALGVAARPILLNLMAGFQIAFTKTIKIEDAVFIEGDYARIESIHLTHVIARTWDLRRIVLPISYFIDKPFQNWTAESAELIGVAFIYCDYTIPVDAVRKKFIEILKEEPLWNGNVGKVQVVDFTEQTVKIRLLMTAHDPGRAYELRCIVREKLIAYIQEAYPSALPQVRYGTA